MRTQALWRTMVVTAGVACLAVAVGGGASAGVVSHWTFDADFTDATGAHHAFVGTGSPTITTADSVFGGGALALNGSSSLDTGSWPLGGSHTVACWVNPANIAANWAGFLDKQEPWATPGGKTFWLGQQSTDGKIRFGNYFNGSSESALDTGFALTNGEWYHVVGVWDDANDLQTVYVNGREVRQIARPGANQPVGNDPLWIGRSTATHFTGTMDEVWIFDSALTPAEVQNLTWANDAAATPARQLVRVIDFETGDMDGWSAVAGPGNNQVFRAGNMPTARPTVGFDETTMQGDYFIRTWEGEVLGNSDANTGIAQTTPFILGENARFDFMVGGGNHPFTGDPDAPAANVTAINLERLVAPGDWEVIATATGINGNYLNPVSWDASDYAGETVRLRIYDTHTGGWGHIDVDSIRYSATEILPQSPLISVDIQGTPGGAYGQVVATTMMGPEPITGVGQFWNAFVVAAHDAISTNPAMALVDSNGNPTPVTFSINGTVSGFNYAGTLQEDYLFISAGAADPSINWALEGLEPNWLYEMYLYGGHFSTRDSSMLIDTDGDGSLADETPFILGTAGAYAEFLSSPEGTLIGLMNSLGHEGNWAGFQLYQTPEPTTLALLGLGGLALLRRRRR